MPIIENFVINPEKGFPIVADLYLCEGQEEHPIIIYCHGFKGFKDWGHIPLLPAPINKAGFHFLKFNFSHNGGTLDNPIDFNDLESFANNNFSIELNDLKNVIDWTLSDKNDYLERINNSKIYLIGHSRGGAISILTAAKDNRIKKLITWAALSDFSRRFPDGEKLKNWKEKGVYYIENIRTKQDMPLNYQFYEDYLANQSKLNIANAERALMIDHLLIHGTKDETVFLGEAIHLMSLNEKTSLIKLKDATHTFGGFHPFKGNKLPEHAEIALNYSLTFLQNE